MSNLQLLACKNCGASLSDPPAAGILVCKYCDHRHVLDAPPPHRAPAPGPMPPPPIGYGAHAPPVVARQSAMLYPILGLSLVVVVGAAVATFTLTAAPTNSATRSAVATGAAANDHTVGATYRKGEAVRIHWGSTWWDGKIVEVKGEDQYEISYDGYSASSNEVVGIERLQKIAGADEDDRADKKRRKSKK